MESIATLMGVQRRFGGQIGLEIELEGVTLPDHVHYWNVTDDGSLRSVYDEEGKEYVLTCPANMPDVICALNELQSEIECNDSDVMLSHRCSVHVHLNISDLDKDRLLSIVILWVLFEQEYIKLCGKSRKGNLFCLSTLEAEEGLRSFCKWYTSLPYLSVGKRRYGALNFHAIEQYGSLEFRSMEGTLDKNRIMDWVQRLATLRAVGAKCDPDKLLKALSGSAWMYEVARLAEMLCIDAYDRQAVMANAVRLGVLLQQRNAVVVKHNPYPPYDI